MLETSVYRKPTNTGLLLRYHSNVDKRYEHCLVNTMIYSSYRLSSSQQAFESECDKPRSVFSKLCYPNNLISYIFSSFTKIWIQMMQTTQSVTIPRV